MDAQTTCVAHMLSHVYVLIMYVCMINFLITMAMRLQILIAQKLYKRHYTHEENA